MLLIDAIYIHKSGGKSLLVYFLSELQKQEKAFTVLLDSRIDSVIAQSLPANNYLFVRASELNRKKIYQSLPTKYKAIFCFANVPPPVAIRSIPVYICFHNTLLLSSFLDQHNYSLLNRVKLFLKQVYIRVITRKQYNWVVQTNSMQAKLKSQWNIPSATIHVLPFFTNQFQYSSSRSQPFQFVYVADGVPQKNHSTLLAAWDLLFKQYNLTPTLHLTVPAHFVQLNEQINQLQQKGLSIINHGVVNQIQLQQLYHQCAYLIFPSLAESFGLPLIEAVQSGCGVIAANRPYVYDVIKPSAVFNPQSPREIADLIVRITKDEQFDQTVLITKNCISELIHLTTH
jgi:glycosyltransferase involved in cell wall biosynthesis